MSATPPTTAVYEHVQLDSGGATVIAGTTMKVIGLVMAQLAHGWSPEELEQAYIDAVLPRDEAIVALGQDRVAEIDYAKQALAQDVARGLGL